MQATIRSFYGGCVDGHSIAIPKGKQIHEVQGDVYTLRLLADKRGQMHSVMVLRTISDEVAEDYMNGVTKTLF